MKHKRNSNLKQILLTLSLIIALSTISFAQALNSLPLPANSQQDKPITVDGEFLRLARIAIAERDKFKAESEAKDEVIAAKDRQLDALRGLLQLQTQISTDWKEAATARKDALKTDDKLLLQYDKRVAELQAERDSARRNGRWLGVGGLIFGLLAGVFAAKGN